MNGSPHPENDLTIVMYHYVRPLEESAYPSIKGLRVSEFKTQLAYLSRHHQFVTVGEIAACLRGGEPLPLKAVLLTFDDGYRDHYEHAFPLLHDLGVQGAFFPPVAAVKHARLLDVNRIHFILATTPDHLALARTIDRFVEDRREADGLKTPAEYWSVWGKPDRFDTAETVYVKRMLQVALPEAQRAELAGELFRKYVTSDEPAFARELYVDPSELRIMQGAGMYVGCHGDSHSWLDSLPQTQQAQELDAGLAFMREVGSPVDDYWVMCYPYGVWNESLLEELRVRQCTFGLTAVCRVARLGVDDSLLLPRLDTNDLPKTAEAVA
jgi:peptidoglycan/xylan/chitin deacetylase (PgdA/CDA1 family)